MNNKDIRELMRVKEAVREEEISKSRIEGKLETLKKQLKKYGGSIKSATTKLTELQTTIEKTDKQIEQGFDKLEDLGFI